MVIVVGLKRSRQLKLPNFGLVVGQLKLANFGLVVGQLKLANFGLIVGQLKLAKLKRSRQLKLANLGLVVRLKRSRQLKLVILEHLGLVVDQHYLFAKLNPNQKMDHHHFEQRFNLLH